MGDSDPAAAQQSGRVSGIWSDLCAAFAFLTVLPGIPSSTRSPGYAFAYFPLVGLVIGAALWVIVSLPLPVDARAFFALVAWIALTGGLHLDGWGDACDGLLATTTPERRLEIMKDPRAGMWAVVGISTLLLGKFGALRLIAPLALVAAPIAGRWAMALAAGVFQSARASGSGAYFRTGLGRRQLVVASLITALACGTLGWFDRRALLGLAVAPLLAFGLGRWAAQRLGGGLTGDVYGALCELTELVCLWGAALWAV
ncbi:MAG: adenosylcobinamide-GDP ribazoletransferase [Chloroflexi bacterium]|nr:adenosylcobinamide-GDP ribazoletransferase [Chloroflexota bacterium]